MHHPEKFLSLLDKYVADTITEAEHQELLSLTASGEYDYLLDEHFYHVFHQEDIAGHDLHPQKAQKIIDNIRHSEKRTAYLLPDVFRKKQIMRWRMAAAVIVGLMAIAAAYWLYPAKPQTVTAETRAKDLIEEVNQTSAARSLQLNDGSTVVLQPGAILRYPSRFTSDKRVVHLEGEAFFDVKKNADQPFFVYHHHLVTHVLGTSFHVKADRQNKQVEVTVVTGRVQVYEDKNVLPEQDKNINGVILTPNQKVIYKEAERQFTATLVNDPLPLAPDSLQTNIAPAIFAFEETPLSRVLQTVETTYGIEILVETDKLYNCLFTGDITKHQLYTKLDIICASIKASYQVVGTKILIKGKGCN
jgi:hypothetical protein